MSNSEKTIVEGGRRMSFDRWEIIVLDLLRGSPSPLTIAEIVGRFPMRDWSHIFFAVDRLRKYGWIFRKRREYSYVGPYREAAQVR